MSWDTLNILTIRNAKEIDTLIKGEKLKQRWRLMLQLPRINNMDGENLLILSQPNSE